MTDLPRLREFDAASAQPLVEDLVSVYLDVYGHIDDPFFGEQRYRRQLDNHLPAVGWRLVTAERDGVLAGYAYGFPLGPATRWWEGLRTTLPDGWTREDGHRTFAISEIMVRAPWRRQGVATALHHRLLADRPEQRATLLVKPDNGPARAAYASWGWRQVARLLPHWEGAPLFDVMMRPLPVTTGS